MRTAMLLKSPVRNFGVVVFAGTTHVVGRSYCVVKRCQCSSIKQLSSIKGNKKSVLGAIKISPFDIGRCFKTSKFSTALWLFGLQPKPKTASVG